MTSRCPSGRTGGETPCRSARASPWSSRRAAGTCSAAPAGCRNANRRILPCGRARQTSRRVPAGRSKRWRSTSRFRPPGPWAGRSVALGPSARQRDLQTGLSNLAGYRRAVRAFQGYRPRVRRDGIRREGNRYGHVGPTFFRAGDGNVKGLRFGPSGDRQQDGKDANDALHGYSEMISRRAGGVSPRKPLRGLTPPARHEMGQLLRAHSAAGRGCQADELLRACR